MFSQGRLEDLLELKEAMTKSQVDPAVIVSDQSIASDDPYEIIYSNVCFLNGLLEQYIRYDEMSPDALRSYFVDYYLGQVNNGGFSQFVYNTGWDQLTVRFIHEGLQAMNALRHLQLFQQSASILDRIGPEGMEQFFESEYFGENAERDILNEFDDKFYDLSEEEDLIALNSQWLRGLPNLVVMSKEAMQAEIERRAAALPDREAREAEALENEPSFMKLIRALCATVQQDLQQVTAGDPAHQHNGQQTLAWHFITDRGHHYMVEAEGKALMFHGKTREVVAEVETP